MLCIFKFTVRNMIMIANWGGGNAICLKSKRKGKRMTQGEKADGFFVDKLVCQANSATEHFLESAIFTSGKKNDTNAIFYSGLSCPGFSIDVSLPLQVAQNFFVIHFTHSTLNFKHNIKPSLSITFSLLFYRDGI